MDVHEIVARLGGRDDRPRAERQGLLIPVLQQIQDAHGRIPREMLPMVGSALGLPAARVLAVASAYPAFAVGDASAVGHAWIRVPGVPEGIAVPPFSAPSPLETRRVLARCGHVDPQDLDATLAAGAYAGLRLALAMRPEEVMEAVRHSGLRGRGGAGFPTAAKWAAARAATGDPPVIVCNAAEGDVGAFADRLILERDPYAVLEGMAIAAWAVGARRGFLYLRAEYEALIPLLEAALQAARERNLLGQRILGTPFDFDVRLFRAAGRYVCGEETALLESMEGRRPRPRPRPPYPTQEGLWGAPTVINNVKTLATVPLILRDGADAFTRLGTTGSAGTAILALSGDVVRPGVIEVSMGTPLRTVVEGIGGGVRGGRALKGIQTGGPLGRVLPADCLDTPVSYEGMQAAGSPLGSGGLIVLSDATCMVAFARAYADFVQHESCGHCVPCRLGTARAAALLAEATDGRARAHHPDLLESLAATLRSGSACAFGQSAANIVVSTLAHFRAEYVEHVEHGRCPAGVCALS